MKSVIFLSLCISLLALCAPTHAVDAPPFSGMSYLDNGTVRIGINLDIGGAMHL